MLHTVIHLSDVGATAEEERSGNILQQRRKKRERRMRAGGPRQQFSGARAVFEVRVIN